MISSINGNNTSKPIITLNDKPIDPGHKRIKSDT